MEAFEHGHGHDEEHHEKKSVLKKVKEKAKKIKNTITKKHEHGEDHHSGEEEQLYSEEEEKEEDAEIHGAPIYESEAARGFVESHESVKLGGAAVNLERDPGAPSPTADAPPVPGSYQPGLSSAGGPEPGLIRSFEAMSTEEKTSPSEVKTAPKGESEQLQPQSELASKEKITSTLVDKAVQAKETAVMAAAGTAEYGKKIAETVYEKIAPQKKEEEAVQGSKPTDKWVTMKEYLAEKLSPGEEDRALSEVISESIQKRKEEEGDIREEAEEKRPAGEPSGEKKSRKGVVGKIKGAVVSVFGGQPSSSPVKARAEGVPSSRDEQERAPRLQESTN